MSASATHDNTGRRILALVTAFAVVLSLMIVFGAPAQSQTEETGIIEIKKLAQDDLDDKDGNGALEDFEFSGDGGIGDFTLQHNDDIFFEVPLNTPITISEIVPIESPQHWYLEKITCDDTGGDAVVDLGDDPTTGSVTITVTRTDGIAFKCRFNNEYSTNALNTGRLIVEKRANDDNDRLFEFEITGEFEDGAVSTQTFSIDDIDGEGPNDKIDIRVPLNELFVVEEVLNPAEQWYLEAILCDASGGTAGTETGGRGPEDGHEGGSITMTVTGQQFECNFDNELEGHVTPTSSTTTTTAPTTTTSAPTTPTTAPTTTTTIPPPPPDDDTFIDDDGSIFEADIEWLAAEGVTKGCNPPTNDRFCPKSVVTRETMAAFLVRFLELTVDTHDGFKDVSGSNIFKADIEKLATAGITMGCNPPANDMFCPKDAVTRETMAAFLVRALGLTADNHSGFNDVSASNIFKADIEKLATAGITKGCNPPANTLFCPKNEVTRETMAAFLHRAGPLR